jgi:hypothetical protein
MQLMHNIEKFVDFYATLITYTYINVIALINDKQYLREIYRESTHLFNVIYGR